jgi:hypothetical protein
MAREYGGTRSVTHTVPLHSQTVVLNGNTLRDVVSKKPDVMVADTNKKPAKAGFLLFRSSRREALCLGDLLKGDI